MIEFIVLFLFFYVWHAMGITIGYHRGLAHRAFFCSRWVEYFWVVPGYLSFEGSPIWWATMHRAHHKHTDTPLDPHAPKNGLMYSLNGWLNEKQYPSHIDPAIQSKDLIKDPIYRFLECNGNLMAGHAMMFVINISYRAVILYFFGWIPALASLLAGASVLGIPLLLNVVCHLPAAGYKNYDTTDDSVNVWWVALLAQGEGWHNNHHACPGSARSGMKAMEFDTSWWMLCLMRKLGLIYRVNEAKHYTLMKRAVVIRMEKRKKMRQRLQHELFQVAS